MSKRELCKYEFDFSEQDWADIKAIAIELMDSGQYNRNQLKCSIAAFLIFGEVGIEEAEMAPIHGQTVH
jgi:hypothetical protein